MASVKPIVIARCLTHIALVIAVLSLSANPPVWSEEIATDWSDKCECTSELFDTQRITTNRRRFFSATDNTASYYCGKNLNQFIPDNRCRANRLYMCSAKRKSSNHTAIEIGRCPPTKKSLHACNDSFLSRNECLRAIDCTCRDVKISFDRAICGHQLRGDDCVPNVAYRCRRIGRLVPMFECVNGCVDGRCAANVSDVRQREMDKPASRKDRSTNTTTTTTTTTTTISTIDEKEVAFTSAANVSNATLDEQREVEFVTFQPLIHIPLFNP